VGPKAVPVATTMAAFTDRRSTSVRSSNDLVARTTRSMALTRRLCLLVMSLLLAGHPLSGCAEESDTRNETDSSTLSGDSGAEVAPDAATTPVRYRWTRWDPKHLQNSVSEQRRVRGERDLLGRLLHRPRMHAKRGLHA
jgi:hypothetical protein